MAPLFLAPLYLTLTISLIELCGAPDPAPQLAGSEGYTPDVRAGGREEPVTR